MAASKLIRLILSPVETSKSETRAGAWPFEARTEDGELVVTSHQPLLDSARELLSKGERRDTLLAVKHIDISYDSFKPSTIGKLSRLTTDEGVDYELRISRYRKTKRRG